MGIGGARHVDVRAGDDPIGAEIPVGAFAVFRLIAEHRGGNMRQVVIPLVIAAINAAQQIVVAVARNEAEQAHRRNRREIRHMVGAIFLDGINLRRRDELGRLIPAHPLPAGLAARFFVFFRFFFVFNDAGVSVDGILAAFQLGRIKIPQHFAHIGKFGPERAVGIP